MDIDGSGGVQYFFRNFITRFNGQHNFVGSREREERCASHAHGGWSFVHLSFQAHVNTEHFFTNAFVELKRWSKK